MPVLKCDGEDREGPRNFFSENLAQLAPSYRRPEQEGRFRTKIQRSGNERAHSDVRQELFAKFPFCSSRINTGEEFGGRDPQGIANPEQDVHGRRLVIVFQVTDVGTVQLRLKGKLFLSQSCSDSGFFEFISQHGPNLRSGCRQVCGL